MIMVEGHACSCQLRPLVRGSTLGFTDDLAVTRWLIVKKQSGGESD